MVTGIVAVVVVAVVVVVVIVPVHPHFSHPVVSFCHCLIPAETSVNHDGQQAPSAFVNFSNVYARSGRPFAVFHFGRRRQLIHLVFLFGAL
jgi:hypothetical protein